MKTSFRDPHTQVLTAHGYMTAHGDDLARDEQDDFHLEPGKWQLIDEEWMPHESVTVPQSVSMRQGREALIRRGHFATVDAHIANMAGVEGDIARNEWDKSQVIERSRPLTLQMGQLLGLDDAGLDELFSFAATL